MNIEVSQEEFIMLNEEGRGFCIECGAEHYSVEPDAEKYSCNNCKKQSVYGMESLLLMERITFRP